MRENVQCLLPTFTLDADATTVEVLPPEVDCVELRATLILRRLEECHGLTEVLCKGGGGK